MGVYKQHGNPNWWYRYRDADGKVQRRSSSTTDREVAELMLADALGEVATIRRARLSDAASLLGSWELEVGSDRDRIDRLDRFNARLSRLLVGQYELLRMWVEDETAARGLNND
jgi:hypothetical protein